MQQFPHLITFRMSSVEPIPNTSKLRPTTARSVLLSASTLTLACQATPSPQEARPTTTLSSLALRAPTSLSSGTPGTLMLQALVLTLTGTFPSIVYHSHDAFSILMICPILAARTTRSQTKDLVCPLSRPPTVSLQTPTTSLMVSASVSTIAKLLTRNT